MTISFNNLTSKLYKRYQHKSLHHFIALSPIDIRQNDVLDEFIRDFFKQLNLKELNNHADVLLVRKEKDQKAYKLKELESILPFMRHQPIELNYKFIIIDEAESISEIALNKLLKTLEEPEIMACFFFLNRSGKKFLQTINSRSIHFYLTQNKHVDYQLEKIESFEQFQKYIIDNELSFSQIQSDILFKLENNTSAIKAYNDAMKLISSIKTDIEYNNQRQAILFKLYSLYGQLS